MMMVGFPPEHHAQIVNSLFYYSTVAVFQFSMMYYSVSEDSGIVSVCLELINGTLTEDVSIQVMVANNNNSGVSGCKWSLISWSMYIVILFISINSWLWYYWHCGPDYEWLGLHLWDTATRTWFSDVPQFLNHWWSAHRANREVYSLWTVFTEFCGNPEQWLHWY